MIILESELPEPHEFEQAGDAHPYDCKHCVYSQFYRKVHPKVSPSIKEEEYEKRLGELIEGLREYDDGWYAAEIVSLFRSSIAADRASLVEQIDAKLNVYYRSVQSQDCSRGENEKEKNVPMLSYDDVLALLKTK